MLVNKRYIPVILLIFVYFNLYSQFSTFEIYGAKSFALADVGTVFTDINSSYTNVAGLAAMKSGGINLHYQNRFGFEELKALGFSAAFKYERIGTFAVTVKDFGIEQYNEFEGDIAYSRMLTNALSGGIQFSFFNLAIKGYGSKNAVSLNAGLQYRFNGNLLFGFFVKNPFPVKFSSSTRLPTIVAMGVRFNTSDKLIFYSEVEKHIDFGYSVKIALEYKIADVFTVYGGYENNPAVYSGYGFGFAYSGVKKISIELTAKYNITLGISPSIGITYLFRDAGIQH